MCSLDLLLNQFLSPLHMFHAMYGDSCPAWLHQHSIRDGGNTAHPCAYPAQSLCRTSDCCNTAGIEVDAMRTIARAYQDRSLQVRPYLMPVALLSPNAHGCIALHNLTCRAILRHRVSCPCSSLGCCALSWQESLYAGKLSQPLCQQCFVQAGEAVLSCIMPGHCLLSLLGMMCSS